MLRHVRCQDTAYRSPFSSSSYRAFGLEQKRCHYVTDSRFPLLNTLDCRSGQTDFVIFMWVIWSMVWMLSGIVTQEICFILDNTDNKEIIYVLFHFQNKESRLKIIIFPTLEISVNSNLYNCKTFSSDAWFCSILDQERYFRYTRKLIILRFYVMNGLCTYI